MKWRLTLVIVLAALVAVVLFLPNQQWWAATTLLSVGGGIYYERHEAYMDAKAALAAEDRDPYAGIGLFIMLCFVAFVIGIGWSLLHSWRLSHSLSWWSLGIGILNALVLFAASLISNSASEEAKRKTAEFTPALH